MEKTRKGLAIAREILLFVTFGVTIANVILMIVQMALNSRDRGFIKINDSDELPF